MLGNKIYIAGIISCLLHGIFISIIAGFSIPHIGSGKEPLKVDIIEVIENVHVAEKEKTGPSSMEEKRKEEKPMVDSSIVCSVPLRFDDRFPQKREIVLKRPSPKCGTVFLLDASESMVINIDTAKEVIAERLNRLSQSELINIAFFSDKVNFFSPRPLALSTIGKKRAITFCQEIIPRGSLDAAIGLREVLKTNPSRIVLISDGLARDKEMAYDVIENAKGNGVIIDTILIRHRPFEEEVLKKAASLTGGTFSVFSPADFTSFR